MTSRVSFAKLYKETLQRHLTSLIVTVFCFFLHFVIFFLNFQNIIAYEWDTIYLMEEITNLCSPDALSGLFAAGIAVFLAYDYFRYLHSKRETDFYNSLPITRKQSFQTAFVCCFSLFAIGSFVINGLELAIVFGSGYGSFALFQNFLWNLICMLLIYLAFWVTAALAMILTGHSVIALFAFGTFCVYVPVILHYLVPTYQMTFFETYTSIGEKTASAYFSPLSLAYKLLRDYNNYWKPALHTKYMFASICFVMIVGAIAYALFLRRPSETAGRATAYEKANPVIRILLVIPLSLYLGLFLRSVSAYASDIWMGFGILLGAIILHGILECVFQFDVRALFTKKKQLLLSILACFAFVLVFWMDLFHYDEYLPELDDVKSIQISLSGMYSFDMYGQVGKNMDTIPDELLPDALSAAEDIIFNTTSVDYCMDNVTFAYHLKNGNVKYRTYQYNTLQVPKGLNTIFATETYKKNINNLYTADYPEDTVFTCTNGLMSYALPLTLEEREQLIETYLKEYTALTLTEHFSESVPFEISVDYPVPGEEYTMGESFSVYESFKSTIALLKSYGAKTFYEMKNLKLVNLEIYTDKYDEEFPIIKDEKQLEELKEHMLLNSMHYITSDDSMVHGTLLVKTEYGEEYLDVTIPKEIISKYID